MQHTKGYGFVESEQFQELYGGDVFAHMKAWKDPEQFKLAKNGDPVSIYVRIDDDGKPKAANKSLKILDPDALKGREERSKVFPEHWKKKDVVEGLLNRSLVEGILRVNPKQPRIAFVDLGKHKKAGQKDILIEGHVDRNRAIHGDRVVCEIIVEEAEEEDAGAGSPSAAGAAEGATSTGNQADGSSPVEKEDEDSDVSDEEGESEDEDPEGAADEVRQALEKMY